MNGFELFAILTTATGYAVMVNSRYLKLPTAMGLMLISLFAVGVVLLLDQLGFQASAAVIKILPTGSEFQDFFVNSSLALMLYAAAISVDTGALRRHALPILFFATVGTFLSVILVAVGTWWVARLVGVPISPGIALLFGAIVAPTDPIAVSKVTEKIRGWRTWKAIVTGESLFNDAIALIVFTVVLSTLQGDTTLGDVHFFQIFLSEVLIAVGVGLGCVFGVACLYLLIHAENAEGRLLVGIGIASGGLDGPRQSVPRGELYAVVLIAVVTEGGIAIAVDAAYVRLGLGPRRLPLPPCRPLGQALVQAPTVGWPFPPQEGRVTHRRGRGFPAWVFPGRIHRQRGRRQDS